LAGSTRLLLLCLVGVQIATTFFSFPNAFELLRVGEISVLTFLDTILAAGLLAIGGLLILAKRRSAAFLFSGATLVGLFTAVQWHPPFVLTGIVIAFACALVVFLVGRRAGA
jgi:hypothetical protein